MSGERKTGSAWQPGHLVAMGGALMGAGEGRKAVALVRQALASSPDDPALRAAAGIVLGQGVPGFHLGMLADKPRNAAFRRAIERHAPGRTVLDIGAGSGLLAMMAARAGAARVFAVEANEALAETAREIVAANGLSDKVTVIAGHSTRLTGDEIGGGVDLVVSETFSHHLVGEGALPALRHAMGALALPGARMLPLGASVRIALAEFGGRRPRRVAEVEEFDLRLFNRHASLSLDVAGDSPKLSLRSEPAEPFSFDFESCDYPKEDRARFSLVSRGGTVNGLVQWIRLQLDAQEAYENPPGSRSHWPLVFHPFDEPVEAAAGDEIAVEAWRDELNIRFWQAPTG